MVRPIGFEHALLAFFLRVIESIHVDRVLHEGLHVLPASTPPGDDLVRLGRVIGGGMDVHAEVIEPVRKRGVGYADPAGRAMQLLEGNRTQVGRQGRAVFDQNLDRAYLSLRVMLDLL